MANEEAVKEKVESKEEVLDTIPTLPEFNPDNFMEGLHQKVADDKEKTETVVSEDLVDEVEEKESPIIKEAVSDVNTPDLQSAEAPAWKMLATDLDIEAETYESLIEQIKNKKTEIVVKTDETMEKISNLLRLDDLDLVTTWMGTRPDYSEDEVNERLELWQNTGELKHQAKNVRLQLENRKKEHVEDIKNKKASEEAKQREVTEGFTKKLNEEVSKTESLYSGAYAFTDDDKEELVSYIVEGKFQKDIIDDVSKLIEAAHYTMKRDDALNIIRQVGQSEGTQKALEKIRPVQSRVKNFASPDKDKSPYIDASKFLSGLD